MLSLEIDPTEINEYEVLNFDQEGGRELVAVGEQLPVLPIWLASDHAISLDLEASYTQTCGALRLI